MRSLELRFALLATLSVACGGGTDAPSTFASPRSAVTAIVAAPPAAPPPPIGTVDVVVRDDAAHDVWLMKDYQAPLWLEIDGGVLLNGYGQTWCAQVGSHNEPVWFFEKLAAGESLKVTWDGYGVSFDASAQCWQRTPLAAGKHSARACVYDTDPSGARRSGAHLPAGPGPWDPPSTWLDPPATRCVGFTIDLPASGATSVDVSL